MSIPPSSGKATGQQAWQLRTSEEGDAFAVGRGRRTQRVSQRLLR